MTNPSPDKKPEKERIEPTISDRKEIVPVNAPDKKEPALANDNTETPAVAAANDVGSTPPGGSPPEKNTDDEPAIKKSRGKKVLSAAFNIAAGAGTAMAVKSAVVSTMTWAAAPAVATLVVSSLAVGLASTLMCHLGERHKAKKAGSDLPKFFRRETAKRFAKNSGFALLGGALALGFSEGLFDKIFGSTPAPAAPAIVAAPVAVVVPPVEAVCAPLVDRAHEFFGGPDMSSRVADALNRSESLNPRIAAQGTKDLAYFAFNGFDGVPKDPNLALELFQKAADGGNVQAKIDMLYIQYHGLAGVKADPQAAMDAMRAIDSPKAVQFVQQWGGAGKESLGRVVFDSKAILGDMKLCTP